MIYKIFNYILKNEGNIKFTIIKTKIDNIDKYYAKMVVTDLQVYKDLSDNEKATYLGVDVTDGSGNIVYYKNPEQFELDLKLNYGISWLKAEN